MNRNKSQKDLTQAYFDGSASQEELEQLSQTIYDSDSSRKAFVEDKQEFQTLRPMTNQEQMAFLKVVNVIDKKIARRRTIRNMSMAAIMSTACIVAAVVFLRPRPVEDNMPDTEFYALEGSSNIVTLPDSTTVRLLSGARLVKFSDFTPENRVVRLTGEAVFDVTTDAEHPFEIITNSDCKVKVYGTKFDLLAPEESDELKLTLLRGKVTLESDNLNYQVSTGETVRYSQSTGELSKATINIDDYQAWMDGNIMFKNITFSELTSRLEGIYGVKIVLSDNLRNRANHYSISMKNREDLSSLLDALSVMVPISTVYDDGIVFISKK